MLPVGRIRHGLHDAKPALAKARRARLGSFARPGSERLEARDELHYAHVGKAKSLEAEEYRRTSVEIWEEMAPGWERFRAHLEEVLTPVREWLISEIAPHPGETVLELGAGQATPDSRPG